MINLPFFRQHTSYTCGPTSLEMVLVFLGRRKNEKNLSKEAHTNSRGGTNHEGMIRTACQEGFYSYVNSGSSIEEIKHFLASNHPVIVDFIEPKTNEGHYAVIVGIVGEKIVLNDPWNGRHYKISIKKFKNNWHDPITHSKKWIMVIAKEPILTGKQYFPVNRD